MSGLAATAAIAVSLAGIGRLAATDPKRRRSFGLPPFRGNRQVTLAMTAVFLPPVLLLAIGTGADFVAWLGATSVAGWAVAAVSPLRSRRASRWLTTMAARCGDRVGRIRRAVRRPSAPPAAEDEALQRIAALERRMLALEDAIAAAVRPGDEVPRVARLADFHPQRAADA